MSAYFSLELHDEQHSQSASSDNWFVFIRSCKLLILSTWWYRRESFRLCKITLSSNKRYMSLEILRVCFRRDSRIGGIQMKRAKLKLSGPRIIRYTRRFNKRDIFAARRLWLIRARWNARGETSFAREYRATRDRATGRTTQFLFLSHIRTVRTIAQHTEACRMRSRDQARARTVRACARRCTRKSRLFFFA